MLISKGNSKNEICLLNKPGCKPWITAELVVWRLVYI